MLKVPMTRTPIKYKESKKTSLFLKKRDIIYMTVLILSHNQNNFFSVWLSRWEQEMTSKGNSLRNETPWFIEAMLLKP